LGAHTTPKAVPHGALGRGGTNSSQGAKSKNQKNNRELPRNYERKGRKEDCRKTHKRIALRKVKYVTPVKQKVQSKREGGPMLFGDRRASMDTRQQSMQKRLRNAGAGKKKVYKTKKITQKTDNCKARTSKRRSIMVKSVATTSHKKRRNKR